MESMNWKTRTLIIGIAVGTITGLIGALLVIQKAEKEQQKPQLTTGEGVKIGLGVLGLLRLVSDLTEGKS
jgi:hypothetical protein